MLYLLSPVLIPLGNINLLIFFVGLVAVMVFAAVPIAFAFGLATFAYHRADDDRRRRRSWLGEWTKA